MYHRLVAHLLSRIIELGRRLELIKEGLWKLGLN